MTELKNLQKYEDGKSAKKGRKGGIGTLSSLLGIIFSYLTVAIVSKAGITGVGKLTKYAGVKIETKEEITQLPSDYLTGYKERKMNGSGVQKKFGHEPEYFTYEKIAERYAKEKGTSGLGEGGGSLVGGLASLGVPESQKNQVNQVAYANNVYESAGTFMFGGFFLFGLIFGLLFRYLILPLIGKEPVLTEQEDS